MDKKAGRVSGFEEHGGSDVGSKAGHPRNGGNSGDPTKVKAGKVPRPQD